MNNTLQKKRLLVVGAHNDDPEFDAGGLSALLRDLDWEIRFICVTHKRRYNKSMIGSELERTYKDPVMTDRFLEEDYRAAAVLGADKIHFTEPGNGYGFYSRDEEKVYELVDQIESFNPDIVLIHWMKDNHFEHVESASLAMTALSYSKVDCEVHAFEGGPWQSGVYFLPDFIVDITSVMDRVKESLMVFNQPSASGDGLVKEKEVMARYRGYMGRFEYGEAYKIIRFPTKDPELILPRLLKEKYRWAGSLQYMWGKQYFF